MTDLIASIITLMLVAVIAAPVIFGIMLVLGGIGSMLTVAAKLFGIIE